MLMISLLFVKSLKVLSPKNVTYHMHTNDCI